MSAAVQMGLLVGASLALNCAFLWTRPSLAIVAGLAYAAALSVKVVS